MDLDGAGVALVNLGCRVNRVEVDRIASVLEQAGVPIVAQDQAAVIVVNTCAVTGEAEAKTRKTLRHARGLPGSPDVIATGCVASLLSDRLMTEVPGIVVEPNKASVADLCLRLLSERGLYSATSSGGAVSSSSSRGDSVTPTGRTRPGIKIQDGCDNRCSFCIVWKARGRSRSVGVSDILAQVEDAVVHGAHEVVLTGINLGNFRADGSGDMPVGARLDELLRLLLRSTSVDRIRLSSIEPPDVTDALLQTMADSDRRIAPFLHVCLQSGCDATLKRMRRVYDTSFFAERVARAREFVPGIALGTDLIVGFPGETDEEFEASYAFCENMSFARMHVFRYSKRPGTPAAEASDQVDAKLSSKRAQRMRELARTMRRRQLAAHDGEHDLVLVQAPGRGVSSHLFDVEVDEGFAPDSLARVRLMYKGGDKLIGRA